MAERADIERIRALVGPEVSDEQAQALATYYANLSQTVAAFATDELRALEPPLRSIPGPRST
ncbi:MAG TPA: hypothetical protein VGL99_30980 [Chloroflexota bacterium]|jgi:hypothetical protein